MINEPDGARVCGAVVQLKYMAFLNSRSNITTKIPMLKEFIQHFSINSNKNYQSDTIQVDF